MRIWRLDGLFGDLNGISRGDTRDLMVSHECAALMKGPEEHFELVRREGGFGSLDDSVSVVLDFKLTYALTCIRISRHILCK